MESPPLRENSTSRPTESLGGLPGELAFAADIDRTYISQIERGLANPSLAVICRLATSLGVSVTALLTR